jgi:hypothetical protein
MKGSEFFLYLSILFACGGVFWFSFLLQPSFYETEEEDVDLTMYDEAT